MDVAVDKEEPNSTFNDEAEVFCAWEACFLTAYKEAWLIQRHLRNELLNLGQGGPPDLSRKIDNMLWAV